MKFTRLEEMNPFPEMAAPQPGARAVISGSNDFYGANSVENFSSASGLTYTHEDAQGFLDYPTSFAGKGANFWFRDGGVQVWQYEEVYDNWQDTYGMDSAMVFYHSGHGAMDGNGVFQAPLGAKWDNRDWAFSNRMAFGNEELRYLFWSTCFSLRVSGPDNPVRTWWNPNKGGLRMIFGYETTSVDRPEYGTFFWDEWRKGKSFARAFLDASWRISHNQVPVVMAIGANQAEAISRLNNERSFTRTAATKGWYQWQWIGTLPNRSLMARTTVPKGLKAIILENMFDDKRLIKVAVDAGIPKSKAGSIAFDDNGNRVMRARDFTVFASKAGSVNIHYGKANMLNHDLIGEQNAIRIAEKTIKEFGFDEGIELRLGNIRNRFTCGGTMEGSMQLETPSAVETIIQFRQAHKGVESVNSDHGLLAISIDNDGKITNIYNSCRRILSEANKPVSVIKSPPSKNKSSDTEEDTAFKNKIKTIVNRSKNGTAKTTSKSKVLHQKSGYDFSENLGVVVQQRDVEIDFGKGFRKRYKLRVPIMG
jgi:hypothetical protein